MTAYIVFTREKMRNPKNSNSIKKGRGLTRRLIRWRSWRFTEKSRRSKGRQRKALSF